MKKKLATLLLLCLSQFLLASSGVILPKEWKEPTGMAYSMQITAKVLNKDGVPLNKSGSRLAVFDASGVCRGLAEVSNGIYEVTVKSNKTSESGLSYRLLEAGVGEILDLKEKLAFTKGAASGSTAAPLVLHLASATTVITREITVVQGWNWISFDIAFEDGLPQTVLANYTGASEDDLIKGSSKGASYMDGEWWEDTGFVLEAGRRYLLYKAAAGTKTFMVTGPAADVAMEIPVVAGWNWIGFPGHENTPVSALTHSKGFAEDDLIKGTSKGASFMDGEWWEDTGFVLEPGKGYLLYCSQAGTVSFGK